METVSRQAQRLESLRMVAGGIAHDFNNLFAVITSFGTFVAEEIAQAKGDGCDHLDTVGDDIEKVLRASQRGVGLTKQLLTFGHRQVINAEVLDVNSLISRFAERLTSTVGEHIRVALDLAADPHLILADSDLLEQALFNLAVNARDAMPDGGILRIDTANIAVDADSARTRAGAHAGAHLQIRVSDTGHGIPAEIIDKVFEPFFTTKDECAGAGLGLATVYGVVTQTGGTIEVQSDTSAGTVFTMLLPATDDHPSHASPRAPHERVPKGEVVLVVEDDEGLREITQRIFRRNGYRVLTASNGPDAIKMAEQCEGRIHLLLTDVVMPGMLGKEVAASIQTIMPGISVLYMSGYAQPILTNQGRLDPNAILLQKPFSEAEVLKKASQVLNGAHLGFHTAAPPPTTV